jgi:CBS domain-containing protein
MRARDIMMAPVVTVRPETRLKDAAAILVERGISGMPVVDETGTLVGIVSEADLVPLESAPDPRAQVRPRPWRRYRVPRCVEEVMIREVVWVPPDVDASQVARLMLERRIKRIPVVEGERVVGIITRRDLLRVLARTDEEIAEQLERVLGEEAPTLGRWEASVSDGVVTLSGPPDPGGRRLVEILARSIPGVLEVELADEP